jgi:hypothetical protein
MLQEEDEVQNEYLMRCLESSVQKKKMTLEASIETQESHVLKTNEFYAYVGCTGHEDGQSLNTIIKIEDNEQLSQRDRGKRNSTEEMKGNNLMTEKNIAGGGQHSDIVPIDFNEELEFLEDWIENPKVEEDIQGKTLHIFS